jgi:16S rRNA (uracil1498-N3)-methyltransferase
MRLHRFYTEIPIGEEAFDITNRDLVHQWSNVFRYNVGSQVILFDGSGRDYLCIITSLRNLGATVSILENKENKKIPKLNLWLCLGITKKDNFELVVEKATEIGVSNIIPIICERTEKKNLKMDRLNKIIIEAAEQSGRGDLLKIHPILNLTEALKSDLPKEKLVLNILGQSIHDISLGEEIAIFIGPEGGWSDKEISEFAKSNIPSISLGPQTLRAETAAISAASLLLL